MIVELYENLKIETKDKIEDAIVEEFSSKGFNVIKGNAFGYDFIAHWIREEGSQATTIFNNNVAIVYDDHNNFECLSFKMDSLTEYEKECLKIVFEDNSELNLYKFLMGIMIVEEVKGVMYDLHKRDSRIHGYIMMIDHFNVVRIFKSTSKVKIYLTNEEN